MTDHLAAIEIHGTVQGVGFRPFVYRLATDLELRGWVRNDVNGVFIEAEGDATRIEEFLQRLQHELPAIASIDSLDVEWRPPAGHLDFVIRHSDGGGAKTAVILPDLATCDDCLREVLDGADRRSGYPFTNCTNCGPRFSIVRELPYDRPNTTMASFTMCPECRAEYDDPADRRFHAQPNACSVCGPSLAWVSNAGEVAGPAALEAAVDALRSGSIVALKGIGGFQLVVDARNDAAVARLRAAKGRPDKPLAVMAADLEMVHAIAHADPEAATLLHSANAPIVLLPKRAGSPVTDGVAPGNPTIGVMLPTTPLHHLLLRRLGFPVVATSGNLTDEPICTANDEALVRLAPIADGFLLNDRPIERHVDDSVAWVVDGAPRVLRRARGYAPMPIGLRAALPPILATGAHLKNTVAISVGRNVFVSQHIGDLETNEAYEAFTRVIADLTRMYEVSPVAVAHDAHPDYLSTRAAEEYASGVVPTVAVQHHHAHLASCLADNDDPGPALGVTWDGTGYGTDGTIWGGEFLLGDAAGFDRVAHLRPFRLPGGDAAVREPRRSAAALLHELGRPVSAVSPGLESFGPAELWLLRSMLESEVNSPVTTSAGRLFDGVAAMLGFGGVSSFEGQAAIALEYAAAPGDHGAYPMPLVVEGNRTVLDWGPTVESVLRDRGAGVGAGLVAARFHASLVAAIVAVARAVGHEKVALTGGCFQNRVLTEAATAALRSAGFTVLLHRRVPPNDGGISLGQITVAAALLASAVSPEERRGPS